MVVSGFLRSKPSPRQAIISCIYFLEVEEQSGDGHGEARALAEQYLRDLLRQMDPPVFTAILDQIRDHRLYEALIAGLPEYLEEGSPLSEVLGQLAVA